MRERTFSVVQWLAVVLAAVSIPGAIASGQPRDPDQVGYWAFEEGAGATAIDSSDYGNHGQIIDATWTQGRVGGALDFHGTPSRVEVPNSSSLGSFTNQFTFC
ncbi:MAG: hypothetical protein V1774_02240, partial [Candidatus Eisenbacteria bacterium]